MKIKCIADIEDFTKGKVYEGEYGYWCVKGKHKIEPFTFPLQYCKEHDSWGVWGYLVENDKGKEDIVGYWNFESIDDKEDK
ncbi:hypothetical protein DRN58_01220 [Thermococci archaeon]|nr:MAG: hypothetical protein DRN58_01220 [Thermococci archaeon]